MNGVSAIFYRDYRQRRTNVWLMFWDLFAPLAYLILFGIGFERMMSGGPLVQGQSFSYTAFLLPGILAMVSFSVAMNTAWGFFMDKESGIFFEMLTYPISRAQILLGKVSFCVLFALLASVLVIALGRVALDVPVRWEWLPIQALVIAAGTAGWFFMFTIFVNALNRQDAFNTVSSAAYILLMFFSSMFYPLDGLPLWFRIVAALNPMTWQVDILRFALLDGSEDRTVLLAESGALVLFAAVCLVFAVRGLNRAG